MMIPSITQGGSGRKFQLLATLFYKKTCVRVFQSLCVLAPLRALRETKKLSIKKSFINITMLENFPLGGLRGL
jgi:hypothetical protein